jgi:hypothetical protein
MGDFPLWPSAISPAPAGENQNPNAVAAARRPPPPTQSEPVGQALSASFTQENVQAPKPISSTATPPNSSGSQADEPV